MATCPYCRTSVPSGATVCTGCGATRSYGSIGCFFVIGIVASIALIIFGIALHFNGYTQNGMLVGLGGLVLAFISYFLGRVHKRRLADEPDHWQR